MNIPRMYTIALGSFGYTEDEARFLYLVATHSGYFTCQQFIRFINGKPGKRSLTFVRKLRQKPNSTTSALRVCISDGAQAKQSSTKFARNTARFEDPRL